MLAVFVSFLHPGKPQIGTQAGLWGRQGNTPIIHRALEVLNVMTQNDHDQELYEARLKARRDRAAELEDARAQGDARGILKGQILLALRLLKQEPTSQEVLNAMPLDELAQLARQLEEQLQTR
jgi:predicted transposase/invertase (TIGR01784 family)